MSRNQLFDDYFEVILADTQEAKQIHYNLRYQVYCDEMGFEDKTQFPDSMEYDQWDDDATHFVVRHKYSGQYLGALRLAHQHRDGLPFEKYSRPYASLNTQQYGSSVEISRLCVLKNARRFAPPCKTTTHSQQKNAISSNINDYRPSSRSLMWGMIRAAALHSSKLGLREWYILVTPALALTIQKAGFIMTQIGFPCQHRGIRTPYLLNIDHVLNNSLWQQDYQNEFVLYSELSMPETVRLTA